MQTVMFRHSLFTRSLVITLAGLLLLSAGLPVSAQTTYPPERQYYANYWTSQSGWQRTRHSSFSEAAQTSWDAYTVPAFWPGAAKVDWYIGGLGGEQCSSKAEPEYFFGNNIFVDIWSTVDYNGSTMCSATNYSAVITWICPHNNSGPLFAPDGTAYCVSPVTCQCGEELVKGQCVKREPIYQKVWQSNGDLWVYAYGLNEDCGLEKHPQRDRSCPHGDGHGPGTGIGNPINCTNGLKTQTETDYRSGGPDPLVVRRFYSSAREDETGETPDPISAMSEAHRVELRYFGGVNIVKLDWPDGGRYVFDVNGDHVGAVGYSTMGGRLERTGSGWDYISPAGTRYRFDFNGQTGRLIGLDRPGGQSQTVAYYGGGAGQGETVHVSNNFSLSLDYTYDVQGRLIQVRIPGRELIRCSYDDQNRLTDVLYPDDTRKTYHYENTDFPNFLTGITDENGHRYATWAYDSLGRAILSEHANGAEKVTLEYIDESHTQVRTWQSDNQYRDEIYQFEKVGGHDRVTAIEIQPCTNCPVGSEHWQYDPRGYLIQHTDANGNITIYERDHRGVETARTEAGGTTDERTVITQWHNEFRLPTRITELGKTTDYTYDSNGNRLSETVTDTVTSEQRSTHYSYNSQSLLLTINGPRTDVNDITTYAYDAQGNRITITNALNHITRVPDYDAHGNPLTIIDSNGIQTKLQYDNRQRLIERTIAAGTAEAATTHFQYDAVGNLTKITQPNGSYLKYTYDAARRLIAIEDNFGNRIEYTLDAAGNRTREVIKNSTGTLMYSVDRAFDELSRLMDIQGNHSQHEHLDYDVNDNPTAITDGRAHTTQQAYDALNRLTQITDPAQGETHYTYDSQDRLTAVTDPRGLTTTYTYDAFGNLIATISPDTGTTTYTYDNAGNRTSATDNRGITTHYDYDALNRLIAVRYPDNPDENLSYTYDDTANGNPGIGRLTGIDGLAGSIDYTYSPQGQVIAKHSSVNGITTSLTYGYSANGQLTRITYPSGRLVHYQRDLQGNIIAVSTQGDAQAPAQVIATNIDYLPFGPVTALTYGNGLIATRTFDNDYRLTHLTVSSAGPLLQRLYDYDAVNNITRIDNSLNTDRSQSFSYDPLDRLTDALNLNDLFSYTYDPVGNRTEKFHNGDTHHYTYSDASHHLLQQGEYQYQYDAAGNTTDNGVYTFYYSSGNRLNRVEQDGEIVAEYRHNALGQRVLKQIPGVDYVALATEQEALAAQYRNEAAALITQRETLLAQVQSDQQQAQLLQAQADELRSQLGSKQADQREKQGDRAMRSAKSWQARAADFRERIVESPTSWQRITNAIFGALARRCDDRAAAYQAKADALYAEAERLRADPEIEAQIAALEQAANDLLAAAQQAQAEADSLESDADALIAQAEAAEAQARDYRQLAEDPSQTVQAIVYVYNETGQLIGEYDEQGTAIREYIYLDATPLALASNGEIHYYHHDHLDTPQLLTDANQQIVWQANYTPFGKAEIAVEAVINNLRFPGQYFDEETGLHYNYFRDYDPRLGRYIQSDPIGLEGGLNTYVYVENSPVDMVDPFGLKGGQMGRVDRPPNSCEFNCWNSWLVSNAQSTIACTAASALVAPSGPGALAVHATCKASSVLTHFDLAVCIKECKDDDDDCGKSGKNK